MRGRPSIARHLGQHSVRRDRRGEIHEDKVLLLFIRFRTAICTGTTTAKSRRLLCTPCRLRRLGGRDFFATGFVVISWGGTVLSQHFKNSCARFPALRSGAWMDLPNDVPQPTILLLCAGTVLFIGCMVLCRFMPGNDMYSNEKPAALGECIDGLKEVGDWETT